MIIRSPAFAENSAIPQKYTCDGENVSPPIEWTDLPSDARTVALVCDDPDAPKRDFVHWVLFNVPPNEGRLPERLPTTPQLADGARQGKNDFGKVGYGGPCPPGGTHHYRFTLYAVDTQLDLPPASSRDELLKSMREHVVGTAQLTGTYTRNK
jgi:Raf kinase inhibitor-like YbhB/YbcL family protein